MKKYLPLFFGILLASHLSATVRIVTTLPDLADIAKQIGGDKVQVDYIVRGNQNPHFIEVKPSYMMQLRKADIFFMIGMDLELWAQQLIDGSRNAKLLVVDCSRHISKLEVPQKIDASEGDVHRYGNPHYWLNPHNVQFIVIDVIEALMKIDPSNTSFYKANGDAFLKRLNAKIAEWEKRLKPFAGKKIITFHKSWSYFTKWFGIDVVDYIEPKPGIQPSPSHTAHLLQLVRNGNIKAIVVEPFYDDSAPRQIARASTAQVLTLPTSVGGVEEAKDYISLIEYNVSKLEETLR